MQIAKTWKPKMPKKVMGVGHLVPLICFPKGQIGLLEVNVQAME